MPAAPPNLWTLALNHPQIDPDDLAAAIEAQITRNDLDFRTRLLIHQSIAALERCWGPARVRQWLESSPFSAAVSLIRAESFDDFGFPSLIHRVMETTKPEAVLQYLRELGAHIAKPIPLAVGGSAALILAGSLSRRTEDIDVVDEVPAELRTQHDLLQQLGRRYGLTLTHFQSHYLPDGWEQRLQSFGTFGALQLFLVDVHDIFLSKLFSSREKDRDDLRFLAGQLDKPAIEDRFRRTTVALRAEETLRRAAESNWYILYGEPLPQ